MAAPRHTRSDKSTSSALNKHPASEADLDDELARMRGEMDPPELRSPVDPGDVVVPGVPLRLPRQSTEQTRQDLIDAAMRLVNDHFRLSKEPPQLVDLLPFIDLDDVLIGATAIARRRLEEDGRILSSERVAPLTRGAFYKAFADSLPKYESDNSAVIAFKRAVVDKIVSDEYLIRSEKYAELGEIVHRHGGSLEDVARIGSEAAYRSWERTSSVLLLASLALHSQADKGARTWARNLRDEQYRQLDKLYTAMLSLFGRKMRTGLDVHHMSVSIAALVSGMVTSARFDEPDAGYEVVTAGRRGATTRWHLAARASWAIFDSFTEEK